MLLSIILHMVVLSQLHYGPVVIYCMVYYYTKRVILMGIKRFDHETKVKVRLERQNLQTASQLCTKQVGTGEMIK